MLGPLEVYRADLAEEGSYDEAVAGCDYAFLLAAPVNYTSKNPEVRTNTQATYIYTYGARTSYPSCDL